MFILVMFMRKRMKSCKVCEKRRKKKDNMAIDGVCKFVKKKRVIHVINGVEIDFP